MLHTHLAVGLRMGLHLLQLELTLLHYALLQLGVRLHWMYVSSDSQRRARNGRSQSRETQDSLCCICCCCMICCGVR